MRRRESATRAGASHDAAVEPSEVASASCARSVHRRRTLIRRQSVKQIGDVVERVFVAHVTQHACALEPTKRVDGVFSGRERAGAESGQHRVDGD